MVRSGVDSTLRKFESLNQGFAIARFFTACQSVKLGDDAKLHLFGGLVGKGHGQLPPVRIRLMVSKKQSNVVLREAIGFTRTRRCTIEIQHDVSFYAKIGKSIRG